MSKFDAFPDDSWLRVFHAPRDLTAEETAAITANLDAFLGEWASHETRVSGAWEIVHDRFIVVAADESKVALSGCSKDSVVMRLRALGQELGMDFVHGPPICFRAGDDIKSVQRDEFGALVESGDVRADTVVFDSTIITAGPYKAGRWEVAASDCWHARAYELAS